MDWSNVTAEELVDALKEVEWATPPRPLPEFFQKFTTPKTQSKWNARLKCNVYYYRTNYLIILTLMLVIALVRRPLSLVAVIFAALSIGCLNDSFAMSVSEKLTKAIRKISPPLAAKMRPPVSSGTRGRPLKGAVYICGKDRRFFVVGLMSVSVLLWFLSSAIYLIFGSLLLGILLILLHASLRTPNLKARLNSFREEFRAVWRGYSDA
ncbi:hypothetical protein BDL97_12G081500 [Sphagnum fallax]|uniref:PRA1 family protein n=1 Tax=Sphagnum jensenii TaxID=128206 RepID=A0ABP1AHV3_9BRYO|nr:hypothetical protein BDL97_12G081500 [Sphagnum fallax]KAH8946209.1 hypothetical protein BDL97_12G081500 [Sphagnum fallax]